jgi:hypothetical protein
MVVDGNHSWSGQTAAGLPVSGRSAKASMMKIGSSIAAVLAYGLPHRGAALGPSRAAHPPNQRATSTRVAPT